MFSRVLVANRGEIALRVMRACSELGVQTTAVYSEADAHAAHIEAADTAVAIGPAPPSESYLDMEALIEAAESTGCEAVHPGYGFLSENPDFARAVRDAGLVFIGPSPASMEALGDKLKARDVAIANDVPVSPGTDKAIGSADQAAKIAGDIGYPVLLKAAAGGGGMGMRRVDSEDELARAFREASGQAEAAFGDGRLFIEKFHVRPRHVEVQLVGFEGSAVHLGERECSIQRRYQKLVEEAPSPAVDEELRAEMGAAAVRLAEAVGYENAGTAEFLLTDEGFFFNEVNARLQVEHPVTELVTGVDLVHAQLRVAAGEDPELPSTPDMRGHAFEFRVNAEDPTRDFMPTPGTITRFDAPAGPGVRLDTGYGRDRTIPGEYDSLLAKLLVWGPNRLAAIERSRRAIDEFHVAGVRTTLPVHRAIVNDEAFRAGDLSTLFLDERPVLDEVIGAQTDADRQRLARVACIAAGLARGGGLYALAELRPLEFDTRRWNDGGAR